MNRSRRFLTSLGFAVALGASVPACVFSASGHMNGGGSMYASEAPPPPQAETVEVRAGYVWIKGHWAWQGRWVWSAGHWERERANQEWVEGSWTQQGNQWAWSEGSWRTAGAHGTITVHDNTNTNVVTPERDTHVDHRGEGNVTTTVVVNDGRPHQPPPELQAENQGSRSGYIWIRGRWDWQSAQWQWVPGHWERERARQAWTDGRWDLQGDTYVWIEGSWGNTASTTGTIKVRHH